MFGFSEDMLPRHFPKVHLPHTKPLDEAAISIPRPTLSSVSLIFSNEINAVPQQSLQQWSEDQHRVKSTKKHVRFAPNTDRHKPNKRTESIGIQSNLESHQISHLRQPGRIMTKVNDKLSKEAQKSEFVKRSSPFRINFQQYDRDINTKVIEENYFSKSSLIPRDNHQEHHADLSSKVKMIEKNRFGFCSHGMAGEQRSQLSSAEILLNILEEQQRHISIQQRQIWMQEKQNLEQEKQICMLECQIEKLLLQNEADIDVHSLHSAELKSVNCFKTENIDSAQMKCGSGMSTENNVGTEKMVLEVGLSNNKAPEGFLFDRTIRTIDSAIFDYEIDKTGNTNTHINFTAQTSICETSTNCIGYSHSQILRDRSFVLNMLGMKYKCSDGEASLGNDPHGLYYKQMSSKERNEFIINEDVSSEMQDYLVRHGLIKR